MAKDTANELGPALDSAYCIIYNKHIKQRESEMPNYMIAERSGIWNVYALSDSGWYRLESRFSTYGAALNYLTIICAADERISEIYC